MKEKTKMTSIVRLVVCAVLIVLSIAVISPITSKPETYKDTISRLNEKEKTVTEVTAVATVSSISLAAIPDDATTPVANKIMDLAGYLVLVLCAIVIEKYLLTIIGYVAFKFTIPIALGLFGVNTFIKKNFISKVAFKLLILSLAMWCVVPVSVRLSDMIEDTYKVSINTTMEEESVSEEKASDSTTDKETEEIESEPTEEEEKSGNWLSQALHGVEDTLDSIKEKSEEIADAAAEVAESATTAVTEITDKAIKKAQDMICDLMETVVVLIVSNCVIPILVLMFSFWVINLITGIKIDPPNPAKVAGKIHLKKEEEE